MQLFLHNLIHSSCIKHFILSIDSSNCSLLKILPKRPYHYYPILDKLFVRLGVYPAIHHDYKPFIIRGKDFDENIYEKPRALNTIDFDLTEQSTLLQSFYFQKVLLPIEAQQTEIIMRYSLLNEYLLIG